MALAALALTACAALPVRPSLVGYPAVPDDSTGPVTARFMGTSTLSFTDGDSTILIDGFFTRPPMASVLFGALAPDDDRIDRAMSRAGLSLRDGRPPDGIFVAHAHYDHALDAAAVAKRGHAVIYGSRSTQRIAQAEGLRDARRTVVLEPGRPYPIGRFRVTAYSTPHSATPLFWLRGDVEDDFRPPGRLNDFQEGGNFAFLIERDGCRILVMPSGAADPGDLDGGHAPVVFLGIGQLGGAASAKPTPTGARRPVPGSPSPSFRYTGTTSRATSTPR
ncbi:MAG: MBL fold metallo-hydrolase [Caulobacteraceae bacterium]|nr:MAG: MBL fold metallo-hydrolase [Caulobacteraceae bacterium]